MQDSQMGPDGVRCGAYKEGSTVQLTGPQVR